MPQGLTVGPFILDDQPIGAGGRGAVYQALVAQPVHGLEPGATVALKLLHRSTGGSWARKSFLREAALASAIRHENLVSVYGAGVVTHLGRPTAYLAMQLLRGTPLSDILQHAVPQPESLCRRVGLEVSRALAALHAVGVLHRDVAATNVFLTTSARAVLMDFGESFLKGQIGGSEKRFFGSAIYAAPEAFDFRPEMLDGRSDLYSLGLLLYEMASGMHPLAREDSFEYVESVQRSRVYPPLRMRHHVTRFFDSLVQWLLTKDPLGRPVSAVRLSEVLSDGEASDWWRREIARIYMPSDKPQAAVSIDGPLVGRDAETTYALGLASHVRAARGCVLLVTGDHGIGKSRFTREIVARLSSGTQLAMHLEPSLTGDESARWSIPLAAVAEAAARRQEWTSKSLADQGVSSVRRTALSATSVGTVLNSVLRALAVADPASIVLGLDSVDLSLASDREVFSDLATVTQRVGCFMIANTAQISDAAIADTHRLGCHTLALPPLDRAGLQSMLRSLGASEILVDEAAAPLFAATAGVPGRVVVVLNHWTTIGAVRVDADGMIVPQNLGRLEPSELPLAPHQALRLTGLEFEAAALAATIGLEFAPEMVAQVGRLDLGQVMQLFQAFVRRGIVAPGERGFRFTSVSYRTQLLSELTDAVRSDFHLRIAAEGETARLLLPAIDVVEHFVAAGAHDRAMHFLSSHLEECLSPARPHRAICLLVDLHPVVLRLATMDRLSVLRARATLHRVLAQLPDELAVLEELSATLPDALRVTIMPDVAFARFHCGMRIDALATTGRCIALARKLGDAGSEFRALVNLGTYFMRMGRVDLSARVLHCCIRHRALSQVPAREANARANLGYVLSVQARASEARHHLVRALRIARRLSNHELVSRAAGNLGIVESGRGHYRQARRLFRVQFDRASRVGYRDGMMRGLGNLANAARNLGDYGRAYSAAREHVVFAELLRDPGELSRGAINLGLIAADLGLHQMARTWARRAVRIARGTGRPGVTLERELSMSLHILASICDNAIDSGSRRVEVLLRRAIAVAERVGSPSDIGWASVGLGRWLLGRGRHEEARPYLWRGLLLSAQLTSHGLEAEARLGLLRCGEGRTADVLACATLHELRRPVRARLMFRLWRVTGDRTHLASARVDLALFIRSVPAEFRESARSSVREFVDIVTEWRAHARRVEG